ncbi:MAG: LTA synthase family protein, partial [Prevotella sp.]|nr:LTA synthase family protein [Prevotella sp.]
MVKKLLDKTYSLVLAVAWNLLLIYLVYQVTRVEYYLENATYLHYTSEVFRGGLVFDTSAILYTNALYIVLMLFPWHIKENGRYHRLCKWVYLVINGVAIAINLADSVYFKYTMRRTTTTVFGEFSNEGNLGSVIGAEFVNHWYLVVLFVVLMLLLWKFYATPQLDHRKMLHRWKYSLICLLSLLMITPFSIAGIRGGWTTAVRPVTLSNANQYVER